MESEPLAANSSLTSRSEPELEQQTSSTVAGSQSNRSVPRSCYGCHRKKVRCDKKEPCLSCTRAGKPCAYPPPGPRIRRPKKTIMADMASRISDLERSVGKATSRDEETSVPVPTTPVSESSDTISLAQPAASVPSSGNLSKRSRDDILVQKGSSSQYFNEILLSRVIEEERNIESILTTPQAESPHPLTSPFNALGILSAASLSQVPSSFHPPTPLAVRLWNIYVHNVEGCIGLKLLHLPTDEKKVYSVIDDPTKASFENLTLCFAVYFASTVSLEDGQEAQGILGQDKHALLLSFKVGLEQAFAHGDFLDCPTLTGLHALAIYLSALRVHNRGKGIWILNGLAIRIAQSLGLHRDGKRLGLPPFQSEIRRRLWWHLLSRDGRAGEDYGLEHTNGLTLVSDVGLPLNVDDTDLYPEMEALPVPKRSWTAMTFSLINIDLTKSMQRLAAAAAASSPSSPPREDVRARVIEETKARVEEWLESCNPIIPQHRMTLFCSRFLLRKLDFITRLQWLLLRHAGPGADFATEENLSEALAILEPRLYSEDGLLTQFAWARKAYPQYHVALYVLWHLCVKPEGPNVDRAWEEVEVLFSHELWDESSIRLGSKSAVLAALKAKAVSVREKTQRLRSPAKNAGHSDCNSGLVSGEDPSGGGDLPVYLLGDMGSDGLDFNMGGDEWPNWATLVQGFQPDGPDVLWH
ncbi:hypothetical protein QBC33DRAFT_622239 [Phialemonium atrogriseum]|uniref:Zn(2)-C6 fungal-type domain-containing protein n=1 Tax=Phialemonium atrogriseum TaxID=1093897 RepID=A0AAJ0FJD0_9PEZI|nr:uncharacterized protein QBC33DRAFT_622239 [Phialemonium atrogriseum]KAK1764279.1 hypothetical protein QBC33DRAFT_622239 [Phialemonium atrogriseum]